MNSPRVVFIADDRAVLRLVEASLRAQGFQVLSFADVYAALKIIDLREPDIVIQYYSPGMYREEPIDKIREFTEVPIIVLTKDCPQSEIPRLSSQSVYIPENPFSINELFMLVRSLLGDFVMGPPCPTPVDANCLDAAEALAEVKSLLSRRRYPRTAGGFIPLRDILHQLSVENNLGEWPLPESSLSSINTGFHLIDRKLGGLRGPSFVIVASRPGHGKTSLAFNIASNASVQQGARVAFFSLDQHRYELGMRILASEAEVKVFNVNQNYLNDAERDRVEGALESLGSMGSIFIEDTACISLLEIERKAFSLHEEVGIDLVIIDYIQLIASEKKGQNSGPGMSRITSSLKKLAHELDVPVVALSRLNVSVERRADHVPRLSDLPGRRWLAKDADVILLLYRQELYVTEEEWGIWYPEKPYPEGQIRIIVAKNIYGTEGDIKLKFNKRFSKFSE